MLNTPRVIVFDNFEARGALREDFGHNDRSTQARVSSVEGTEVTALAHFFTSRKEGAA
jgi:hypothetical protein